MRKWLLHWRRTFHTVRHLQLRQAWYFFLRRGIGTRRVKPVNNLIPCRKVILGPALQLTHADGDFSIYEFSFLNRTLIFRRDAMNWHPGEAQRLWRYNLHYFDFLRDPKRPLLQKIALIDDWIANNPQGTEPAWEPYTTSLRIVNWCVFFWSLPEPQRDERWLRSLYHQAHWLENNLELHILANHYFENIKALLFVATFFDDHRSASWLKRFQGELLKQLREQILSDGGHYERSPQYHCILLEDFLDLYALFSANPALLHTDALSTLKRAIEIALHFLSLIATPDDSIPLFNDSAGGAVNRPSTIFAKANALGFPAVIKSTALIDLPVSGLFGWKSGGDFFLIDCGDIGPSYQPGHTHCDFLSFVLMIDGQWLVVDSGVCEYEPGVMRRYVRSTAAHNTVCIDGQEQSEIWGEFRVGRRAKRIDANLQRQGKQIVFEGAYRGFPALSGGMVHRRRAILTLSDTDNIVEININDTISGDSKGNHLVETFLHLAPSLGCSARGEHSASIEILRNNEPFALITGLSMPPAAESWYCPEFGVTIANRRLETALITPLPATQSYRITMSELVSSGNSR